MTSPLRTTVLLFIVPGLCLLSLSACETTGDPGKGGIFWSESKAKDRQHALEQQDREAQQQLSSEQRQQQGLQRQEAGLQSESTLLQAEIDRLMSENTGLEGHLRALMSQKQLGESELTRLQGVLAQNERLRAALRTGSGNPASASATQSQTLNEENERLHREVMLLMQR